MPWDAGRALNRLYWCSVRGGWMGRGRRVGAAACAPAPPRAQRNTRLSCLSLPPSPTPPFPASRPPSPVPFLLPADPGELSSLRQMPRDSPFRTQARKNETKQVFPLTFCFPHPFGQCRRHAGVTHAPCLTSVPGCHRSDSGTASGTSFGGCAPAFRMIRGQGQPR